MLMFEYFNKEAERRPKWVSEGNSSVAVYDALLALVKEKEDYINSHRHATHFKSKNSYQITGRAVARRASLSSTTVLRSSSYSKDFMDYLNVVVNPALLKKKDERVKKFSSVTKSRGRYESTKAQLVEVTSYLNDRVKALEKKDTEKQVNAVINKLRPEIRKLLFL